MTGDERRGETGEGTGWAYGGLLLWLDLLDERTVARYEACVERLRAAEVEARDAGGAAFIAGLCGRIREFFDGLFGVGVGTRLIGEGDNARDALRCYADFLAFGRAQADAARALFEAAMAPYTPERAARGDGR